MMKLQVGTAELQGYYEFSNAGRKPCAFSAPTFVGKSSGLRNDSGMWRLATLTFSRITGT